MKWLIVNHPKVALHNMKHIPNYGRWDDIIICFMGTELEILVIENCFLRKEKQNKNLEIDYKNKYKLD